MNSEEFEKSKRIIIQFRSLAVIRLLIDEIKKIKDQESRALNSDDEAPKVAFMSEVVQTLCQILSAKEKLTLLPNTQSIALIIQLVGQMKEIRDLFGQFGTVLDVTSSCDNTTLVVFDSTRDANRAKDTINGVTLPGCSIAVRIL